MRLAVLASGSQGNALLVTAGSTQILVDAGLPARVVSERANLLGDPMPERLDAIVLTHAHNDHSGYAKACARAFDAPVYMTQETRRGIRLSGTRTRVFGKHASFRIGDIELHPLPVPHDAPQVALVFEHAGARAALATDLGCVRPDLLAHFAGCGAVLIESNHDPAMLAAGPYPPQIQRRVASRTGHLSNGQTADFLERMGPETRNVVLMHLSTRNNEPGLAREVAERALGNRRVHLELAHQQHPLSVSVAPVPGQLALPLNPPALG